MKTFFMLILLMSSAFAENLTPEQQKQMLEDMRVMKERLDHLEKNKSAPAAPSGLKTTNYQDATTETKTSPIAGSGVDETSPELSAEQSKKLMEDVANLKKNQAESQKVLDEMENEDNQ
jgi:hypothetical protein